MTDFVFPANQPKAIPVAGGDADFPVNRIFCVGRNYAAHAEEMGVEVDREAPFYFTKSAHAYQPSGSKIPYPPGTENYHYEVELVVMIGAPAYLVDVASAWDSVYGYACGLDMTRRDLQLVARSKGRPWDLGKDFEQSAVIGPITKAEDFGSVAEQDIRLLVNGQTKQEAKLSELVWRVDELISDLSKFYHLQPGDVIMTGTPAGVGPVVPGDLIVGTVEGLGPVSLELGPADV